MRLTVAEIAEAVSGEITPVGARFITSAEAETNPVGAHSVRPLATDDGSVSAPSDSHIATGISWDSRTVKPGDLYVALPGERVDGHDYAAAAVDAGAVAVLGTRALDVSVPVIVADDAMQALADLAAYWRGRCRGKVIGLTGSTGKTTTKNLVRDVLATAGTVVATKANQNNELGVPATLLAADEDTDFIVVEMGMRGLGQIAQLCDIAKPDWGLVTNVGESHIELLGSRENIACAKSELFAALPQDGIAFVNAADELAADLLSFGQVEEHGVRVVSFNAGDVWAENCALDSEGRPEFDLCASRKQASDAASAAACRVHVKLELRGMHNVSNACSAAAVGLAAGMTLEQCAEALASAQPEKGRQNIIRTSAGLTVVDDAYNANPDSMRASLSTFASLIVPGRHIAVLGDMGELGVFAQECHERVGAYAAQSQLDMLICVGELAEHIALAATDAGMPDASVRHVSTVEAAMAELRALAKPGDAVLVKASHFMQFERIVEGLVS